MKSEQLKQLHFLFEKKLKNSFQKWKDKAFIQQWQMQITGLMHLI